MGRGVARKWTLHKTRQHGNAVFLQHTIRWYLKLQDLFTGWHGTSLYLKLSCTWTRISFELLCLLGLEACLADIKHFKQSSEQGDNNDLGLSSCWRHEKNKRIFTLKIRPTELSDMDWCSACFRNNQVLLGNKYYIFWTNWFLKFKERCFDRFEKARVYLSGRS